MSPFMLGILILFISALLALALRREHEAASRVGAFGAMLGCAVATIPVLRAMAGAEIPSLILPWSMPCGSLIFRIDLLSALFLLPILLVSALGALYGLAYLRPYADRKPVGSLGRCWFWYNLLVAGMLLVCVSHNALMFLVAWELMSLASFFLVAFDDEKTEVRDSAWTYFIATHLGTAFIIALFLTMGVAAGSFDFADFHKATLGPGVMGVLFLFAVIGFGTKAGFMPFHVWLPEAHPVAPSHVSAVMSGVMIKTGIYGLLRMLMLMGHPPAWWGWTLIGIGLVSGVLGVLFALAQHDLKRLLAYHSVENIGIIAMGSGLGMLGISIGSPLLTTLGFAGALLHVINHALFKSLLFFGAGAVQHGAGTREMDHLGGLLKRLPLTGLFFLIGAVAISGLPPLNGFVSEFLIYLGAFHSGATLHGTAALSGVAVITGLALIGGLAAACFTKVFGTVFLGAPRTEHAAHAHECGILMWLPMLTLAALCAAIGLCAPLAANAMAPVVANMTGLAPEQTALAVTYAQWPLTGVVTAAVALLLALCLLALLRRRLLARRSVGATGTWDCGYARPTARMQYTSSSFAQPITDCFRMFLGTRTSLRAPGEPFPQQPGRLSTETPDIFIARFYRPLFSWITRPLSWTLNVQHGRVQLYVLYVALTLVALLIWALGWPQ